MDHVRRLCSHTVIIQRGRVVMQGPLPEVCAAAGTEDLEEAFVRLTSHPGDA